MRLLLLYAAQIAFIVAGFAAISAVFISINSDAMSSTVSQLLSSTATLATAQAVAPLDKFSVQVLGWADLIYANPKLMCADPSSVEWTPEDLSQAGNVSYVVPAQFRVTPGKEMKLSLQRNNPLSLYVYESFEMPGNASQWGNCGFGRLPGDNYFYFSRALHRGVTHNPDFASCSGTLSTTPYGRLTPQLVSNKWSCQVMKDADATPADFQIAASAMTYDDTATGKWTVYTTFPSGNGTWNQLMTFAVPLTFSTPDPITGAYHCTNAASMDLNAQYLTEALHSEVISGVELAMFWDATESLVAWTLATQSSDALGNVLTAGSTNSEFDDAIAAFHSAGWCKGAGILSSCTAPTSGGSNVLDTRHVFTLRRIVHINARFTIVISGDRDTFFGPGERARAVGIGVSVAVCVVCLATSVMLWLTTVRPLRRLIDNMELAATFSSNVDAEADSCITEVNEANVAFLSMHEQLQMAKPFMPQHLLEQFEGEREVDDVDDETSDLAIVPGPSTDNLTTTSSRRSRLSRSRRSGNRSDGANPLTVSLVSRMVAVLVVNVTGFDKIVRGSSPAEVQLHYAKLVEAVLRVAKAQRGVMDSAQGDHIIVSFNATLPCAAPAAKAARAAFALRSLLADLPEAWQRITCGIAVDHAQCGTLGSSEAKVHATLGAVVRHAVGLQRVARALDDERRSATAQKDVSTATAGDITRHTVTAPGWCVATARVVQDCVTFAHFRYEAVASLPPSNRSTLIASLFPPVDGAIDSLNAPHDAAAEWLYAVDATSNTNPHTQHNTHVLESLGVTSAAHLSATQGDELLRDWQTCALNAAVAASALPRLAPVPAVS